MNTYSINLPFFYKGLKASERDIYPEVLPFSYFFDTDYGLLRQKGSDEVNRILNEVYLSGSLLEGSLSNDSGEMYFKPFVDYVGKFTDKNEKVLEIGAGQGDLLKWLKQNYSNAIGIDPQVQHQNEVDVICDFFPSSKIDQDFDVVLHFGVLEHIEEPAQFLLDQHKHHKHGGKTIIAVPNCEDYIKQGDISLFFHEHFSFFTTDSLKSLVDGAGYKVIDMEKRLGMIFLAAELNDDPGTKYQAQTAEFEFQEKVNTSQARLKSIVNGYAEDEIAIYPAIRILNQLNDLGMNNVKLIDDSEKLKEKYLPTQENLVRPLEFYVDCPPELIVITSRTFKDKIMNKIKSFNEFKNTKVVVF